MTEDKHQETTQTVHYFLSFVKAPLFSFSFTCDYWLALRGHLFVPYLPQWPMTSDFKGFPAKILFIPFFCPIFILQIEPVFPFLMLGAKPGNLTCNHFYNIFGMIRSLTGN